MKKRDETALKLKQEQFNKIAAYEFQLAEKKLRELNSALQITVDAIKAMKDLSDFLPMRAEATIKHLWRARND